ncbi:MAG TPA: ion channel [Xanthomonadaceae bacterium]|nr:ion channel [Xanthomonadaceae bacterium]
MSTADDRPAGRLARTRDWMEKHPSGVLLVVQLLGIVLYPLLQDVVGRAVFGAFGMLVLALAVWVVNRNPGVNWLGWVLAIPAVGLSVGAAIQSHAEWQAAGYVLEALLYLYAAATLTAYMLGDSRVTLDDLFAMGATFTLLAWAFAYAYAACQLQYPGSFTGAVEPEEPRGWMELLFLSFSTLSSTGLSDVIPISPAARALSMLEMFAGVMYMAMVVARLVGLVASRGISKDR